MKWNEALAAYDDECDVIESVREDFGSFLRQTFETVGARVVEMLGQEWAGKIVGDGPSTQWRAGPRDVSLWAWSPRLWAGPKRTLLFGVRLDVRAGHSPRDGVVRRRLCLDGAERAVGALPGDAPDCAKHGELDESIVRVASAGMGASSATDLVEHAVSFIDLVRELDTIAVRVKWLNTALEGLLEGELPVVADGTWEARKLQRWGSGFYVQINRGDEAVWACARPPGQVILAHEASSQVDEALRRALGCERFDLDESGVGDQFTSIMLMDTPDVAVLCSRSDSGTVQQRVRDAFRAYFGVASPSASGTNVPV